MNECLTVFLTTYRRPHYLKLALESVLNQTFKLFKVIVLDNMSHDNTKSVVDSFKDNRVTYVEHDGSLTGTNYIYAFSLVKSNYFFVLHDDDILENNLFETLLNIMEDNHSIQALSPSANYIDSDGKLLSRGPNSGNLTILKNTEYLENYFIKHKPGLVFPAVIYRTSFFSKPEKFMSVDAGPAGDQYVYFQICRNGGSIAIVEKSLFNYRIHNNQDSFIRGTNMDFKLINFLCGEKYYEDVFVRNQKRLYFFIKKEINATCKVFKSSRDKKMVKNNYNMIPRVCKKSFKGKIYSFLFLVFSMFPSIFTGIYFLTRKVFKSGR